MKDVYVGSWVSYAGDYYLVNHVEVGYAWIGNHMHKPKAIPLSLLRPAVLVWDEFDDSYVFE